MTKKWYAVYIGRLPGVYDEWSECQAQVNRFPGSSYVRPDMRYCFRSRRYNPDPRTKHISVPPRHMTLPYAPDFNISYNRHTIALIQIQQRKIHV